MDEVTSAAELPDDGTDVALRPQRLADFAGQPQSTRQLAVVLRAALQRGESAPHLLFSGPPGLGKTTLAQIVAHEMGVGTAFKSTSAPSLEKPGDLVALLTSREPGDVLFIDEVHRLPRVLEEILYPAMEDFVVDIVIGDGPDAKSLRLPLPPFTLVAATTRSGMLSAPLLDRFGLELNFEFYDEETLSGIIGRSARLLGTDITDEAAAELACRSRGTPRIANRLLRRVRDYAQVQGDGTIDADTLAGGLALFRHRQHRAGQGLHPRPRRAHRHLCRPSPGPEDARHRRWRVARHHRGLRGAVPDPPWPHRPDPTGPHRHHGRLHPPGPDAARRPAAAHRLTGPTIPPMSVPSATGAAGLLLVATDGDRARMLLARRSAHRSFPLSWSIPAGGMHDQEGPIGCALREAREEIGSMPSNRVVSVITDTQANGWTFHTVIATTRATVPIVATGVDAHEINSLRWVDASQGRQLNLHPGLRRVWERVSGRCDALVRRQRLIVA